MSRGLYKLIANMQTGGALERAIEIDPSERQVARRKQVTFTSSAKDGDNLNRSS